ncbi:hypothetical protein V8B97DRAFT_1323496 [Scleroderma yunnanense]
MAGEVILTFLPLFILVKLNRMRLSALEGLDEAVILVEPSTKFMQTHVRDDTGHEQKQSVKQRQFAIMAACAFTDHCSQGQTLQYVVVNITSPPTELVQPLCRINSKSRAIVHMFVATGRQ